MNAKYSEFVFYRQSFKLFSYKLYIKYLFKYEQIFPQALIHVVIVKIKQFYLFLVMQFKLKKKNINKKVFNFVKLQPQRIY